MSYKLNKEERQIAEIIPLLVSDMERQAAIKAGDALPTTDELLAGWYFRGDDLFGDAAFWAAAITLQGQVASTGPLTPGVQMCLDQLAASPSAENIERLLAASALRQPNWSADYVKRFDAIAGRCDVYLATWGDEAAAERVGIATLRAVPRRSRATITLDKLVSGLWKFGLAETTFSELAELHDVRSGAFDLAGTERSDLEKWLEGYIAAKKAHDSREEVEAFAPVELDDELLTAVSEDRAERLYTMPEKPTLVVVESLDHLPGRRDNSTSATTRIHSPRAEYGHLAGKAIPLVEPTEIALVAMQLEREMPWAEEVVQTMMQSVAGQRFVRFPPTLLVSPPGTGKTTLAMRLGHLLGLHPTLYSCAGIDDASFGGTSRQWGTGRPSIPFQLIGRVGIANPLIVADEVEKTGRREVNGSLHQTLIPMLETASSSQVFDLYLECPVNLSAVSFLATANGLDGVPRPLLDRFRILHVPMPRAEDLPVILAQLMGTIRLERGVDEEWLPDLAGDEVEVIGQVWKGGSLRPLRRMLEIFLAGREAHAARH